MANITSLNTATFTSPLIFSQERKIGRQYLELGLIYFTSAISCNWKPNDCISWWCIEKTNSVYSKKFRFELKHGHLKGFILILFSYLDLYHQCASQLCFMWPTRTYCTNMQMSTNCGTGFYFRHIFCRSQNGALLSIFIL